MNIGKDEDFTGENFAVSTTVRGLQMNSYYEFRVATANIESVGRYSLWKSVVTSAETMVLTKQYCRTIRPRGRPRPFIYLKANRLIFSAKSHTFLYRSHHNNLDRLCGKRLGCATC